MKREIWIGTAVLLLFMWGVAIPCSAADPQTGAALTSALEKPKESGGTPKSNTDSTAEKTPDQTPEALKSFSDKICSFFNNPDVISLWTKNSMLAWIMLLIWIFVGIVAGKICAITLQKAGSRDWAVPTKFLLDLAGPANLFLIALGLSFGLLWIRMSEDLNKFAFKTSLLMFYIAFFWYIYNLISIVDVTFQRIGKKTDSSLAIHVAPLIRRTLRVFLVVIAAMFIVQSVFKQDIGAWLAGLGIAGLAVSLAAQDSLKNLFGSITIIMDRSFKIGERIICSGCDGVIEDIGLRTTRVRTSAGHVISIPNANIVNSPIENVSRRPAIQRNFALALKLDTPPDKLKSSLKIINDILAEREISEPIHPTIKGKRSSPRVVFSDYKPNGLILNVTYWFAPPNSDEYAAHTEKINLRILEEFNRAGIILSSS
jgi:MscS family membrane protein